MKHQFNKAVILISVLLASSHLCSAQNSIQKLIDSLKYIDGNPLKCDAVSWSIINQKQKAIPLLIAQISDTTLTEAWDACKQDRLVVGDISYIILKEIIPLPIFNVTGMQFDVKNGDCSVGIFQYIDDQRERFQQQVQKYYDERKNKLVWGNVDSSLLSDCHLSHHITGKYFYKK